MKLVSKVIQKLAAEIKRHFNLRADKADDVIIDEILRTEVKMEGSKLWVLIFAILIASIGLNIKKNQQYLSKQENQFQEFKKSLNISQEHQEASAVLPSELRAIFPQISDITISDTISWDNNLNVTKNQNIVFNIKTINPLSPEEQTRIKNWLNLRIKSATITVFFENTNKII